MLTPAAAPACKLAYLTNIPTPYRVDMVEVWARLNPELAITVAYTHPSDQGRGWSTRAIEGVREQRLAVVATLPGYGNLNAGLVDLVRVNDVLMIGGFEEFSYLAAAVLATCLGKPVILLFDGFGPLRFASESPWIRWVKRLTASLCTTFFANGRAARRYLTTFIGVQPDRPIFNQYLSHSDQHIAAVRQTAGTKDHLSFQKTLGFTTDRPVLLCCGYLIARKRVDLVIDAIAELPETQRPLLLVVGSGPLKETLAEQAISKSVPIHFAGFREGMELATSYFAADALVLSSADDPWGLVVNEAMSAGLPVIVSDACGVAEDLVEEGHNGFIFPSLDIAALSQAIVKLLRSDRRAMGARSREIVADWTAERSAANLRLCVENAQGFRLGLGTSTRDVIVVHDRDGRKYMVAPIRLQAAGHIRVLSFFSASVMRKFLWDIVQQRRCLSEALHDGVRNLRFRLTFRRQSAKTVIIGVAPWDYRLLLYLPLSRRNRFIYHTSWPHWNGSYVPRRYLWPLNNWLRRRWFETLKIRDVEIVAVTEQVAASLSQWLGGRPITVIPHLVDNAFFGRRALHAPRFTLLFVGELSAHKGIEIFPRLMELLEGRDIALRIVGDGPEREFIQSLCRKSASITWLGKIHDHAQLADIMSHSQVLLAPSRRTSSWEELFGIAIAEAMAMGLPVIASKHSGPTSLIEDGISGFLVEDDRIDTFAERVLALQGDEPLWRRVSAAAMESAGRCRGELVLEAWRGVIEGRLGAVSGFVEGTIP